MYYYSLEEKLQICKYYYGGHSIANIRDLFSVQFPDSPIPSAFMIRHTIKILETTGTLISNKNKPRRPANQDEDLETEICAMVEMDPHLSSRKIARELAITHQKVLAVLKKHKYKSFKFRKSQELFPDDCFRRMEFCEIMVDMANNDMNFIKNILFTDECTFELHSPHNSQCVRYWSRENLYQYQPTRTQYPQKLNVWAGILGDHIIGPFFINGNLNGQKYLDLIQNDIIPCIQNLNIDTRTIYFQHDGCAAHNDRRVRNFLNTNFPNRWIGTYGPIRWPARSPDLAPNDFYLWGFLKNTIFGHPINRPTTLDEMRQKIVDVCLSIPAQTFNNVRENFINRLTYCTLEEGSLFEHLI